MQITTIHSSEPDFSDNLTKHLHKNIAQGTQVTQIVHDIIADVRHNGDNAVLKYTNKFDNTNFNTSHLRVSTQEIEAAYSQSSDELIDALNLAKKRITSYHQKQLPDDLLYEDEIGVKLGWKWSAIESAGLYVPGGTATYPSAVLMNAIPAQVAGVKRLVMVVPTPNNILNPTLLTAAKIAGINEIYRVGGAQAIAALAYGTQIIPKVTKIVGPGNMYVAEAKRQLFGTVGIDMIAGPSEILVIADGDNNPQFIAADLLSQAEHDTSSRSILITDSAELAQNISAAIGRQLQNLERKKIATQSLNDNGLIIIVNNIDEAAHIANIIAAEHVEILTKNPETLSQNITNAGAIFLGKYTPEAIGDYMAGPSHVLPTGGSVAFSSGLGVFDFLKRSSIISCNQQSFAKIAPATQLIAEHEGLGAHALSIAIRTGE